MFRAIIGKGNIGIATGIRKVFYMIEYTQYHHSYNLQAV